MARITSVPVLPVLLAALLSAPLADAQTPASSLPPAASPAATPAAAATAPPPFRVPPGWRVKTASGGETRYCRKSVQLGSRFSKDECLTREQLELQLQVDAENAARVSQGARVCASTAGCGSN